MLVRGLKLVDGYLQKLGINQLLFADDRELVAVVEEEKLCMVSEFGCVKELGISVKSLYKRLIRPMALHVVETWGISAEKKSE